MQLCLEWCVNSMVISRVHAAAGCRHRSVSLFFPASWLSQSTDNSPPSSPRSTEAGLSADQLGMMHSMKIGSHREAGLLKTARHSFCSSNMSYIVVGTLGSSS